MLSSFQILILYIRIMTIMMILDVIIFNDSDNDNSHNDLIKPILFYGNLHVLLVAKKLF